MNDIILLIFGILVGVICSYFVVRGRNNIQSSGGIVSHVEQQQIEKQARKEKILEMIREHESVTNNVIEKMLNVSDTTATNYLQELEREGKIEQIGERGRFVSYCLAKE